MKTLRKSGERGNAMVEMALVFVPLMFSIFALFELGRSMWAYHTLAMAVKRGARVAIVHGARCADASSSCPVTVASLVQSIQYVGVGLDPSFLQLTFTAGGQPVTCAPANSCATNDTVWPPSPYNAVGQPVTITGKYTFQSILNTMWPNQGPTSFNLAAKSTEIIQF